MDIQSAPVIVRKVAEGFHVAIKGPVHTNVQWLEQELDQVVASKPGRVELDLSDVSYVSTMGIGVLIKFRRGVTGAGGQVLVTSIRKQVYNSFRFARLDELFEIAASAVIPDAK